LLLTIALEAVEAPHVKVLEQLNDGGDGHASRHGGKHFRLTLHC